MLGSETGLARGQAYFASSLRAWGEAAGPRVGRPQDSRAEMADGRHADGDDIQTSFNLEIRIISPSMRGPWFEISKVVDADTTNFKDLVNGIVDQFPCGYGDVVKLYYFCADSKSNIQIHSDQDLLL